MNEVEHTVTEVLEGPHYRGGYWYVRIMADAWGHVTETFLTYKKKETAEKVCVGFKFKG